MKLRYVLLGLVVLLLAGAGTGLYFLYTSIDGLVKAEIEAQGAEILGTRVRVASVKISPTTGEGSIRGLRVLNPSGFPAGDAFTLDSISFELDLATLTQSPIVVKSISFGAPSVRAVADDQGRTNLDVIRKNAERYSAQSPASASSEAGGREILLRVDRVSSSGGSVTADLSAMGGKSVTTDLSAIELRKLGGSKGTAPGEIGSEIAVAFARAVGTAVARAGADVMIDKHLEGQAGAAAKELLRRFIK